MSGTALDHPLVRDYLHELGQALSVLPAQQASELTEQITTHLDDALQPGTTDDEIARVLARLGRPTDLAAEATGSTGTATSPQRRGLRWPGWVALGAAVTIVALIIGYVLVVTSVAPIQARGPSGWWSRRDAARAVYAQADGARQTSVLIRDGQLQGLAVSMYNPSDWTQTILGQWQGSNAPGNAERSRITVSTTPGSASNFRSLRYTRPGSIPPHQTRWVRLLWISNECEEKQAGVGQDELRLQIRVGWVKRVVTIPLLQGWYLNGPSHGPCV